MNHHGEASKIALIELDIDIAAPPDRVWRSLTKDTAKWWPQEFFTDPRCRGMVMDDRIGGHMYEDWGEGRGRVWFTIITHDPPHVLELQGCLFPAFGGPTMSFVRIELAPTSNGTKLKLTDALLGRTGDGTSPSEGWKQIFEVAFKGFVESVRPGS